MIETAYKINIDSPLVGVIAFETSKSETKASEVIESKSFEIKKRYLITLLIGIYLIVKYVRKSA